MTQMLAVLLAAGKGTRLHPLTDHRSKAMMPIAGKPMIERVLEMLRRGGASHFIVVAHPDHRPLIEHLRQPPWAEQVRLTYQEQRLGMAHAVEQVAPLIRDADVSAFLLASSDNLFPEGHVAALVDGQRQDDSDAALTLMWVPRDEAPATAVVRLQGGRVTDIIEKPQPEAIPGYGRAHEALGAPSLYALSTRVLDYLREVPVSPRGEREFTDALRLLIDDGGDVRGEMVSKRMTLTHPQDLLLINRHFLRHNPACAAVEADLPGDLTVTPPVRIEAGAEIGEGCRIGPEVFLEDRCQIGPGAVLRRTVVLRTGVVDSGAVIEDAVVS